MEERRIGSKVEKRLKKVYVNQYDDYIILDENDTSFIQKFAQIIDWMEKKQSELKIKSAELSKKYEDKPLLNNTEDGEEDIDIVQLLEIAELRVNLYKECIIKIDDIFGKDTIRKYFRDAYENIPGYVPDDEALSDFFEEITPIIEEIYKAKVKRMKTKYNKNRKGKHSKTKEELLEEAKDMQLSKDNISGDELNE